MMVGEKVNQIILGTSIYNEIGIGVDSEPAIKDVNNMENPVYVAPWHVYDQPL